MKVLFVDEDFDASVVVRILTGRFPQHTFRQATSLADAWAVLTSEKFDLIFLDIMLPANNDIAPGSSSDGGLSSGVKLYYKIRNDAKNANCKTRIVFITGLNLNESEELSDFANTPPADILTKPVLPAKLEQYLK